MSYREWRYFLQLIYEFHQIMGKLIRDKFESQPTYDIMRISQSHVEEKQERSNREKNLAASIAFLKDKSQKYTAGITTTLVCKQKQQFKYSFVDSQGFGVRVKWLQWSMVTHLGTIGWTGDSKHM